MLILAPSCGIELCIAATMSLVLGFLGSHGPSPRVTQREKSASLLWFAADRIGRSFDSIRRVSSDCRLHTRAISDAERYKLEFRGSGVTQADERSLARGLSSLQPLGVRFENCPAGCQVTQRTATGISLIVIGSVAPSR